MKKVSVLLLAFCLMISMMFTGCGKKDNQPVYDDDRDSVEQDTRDGMEDVKDGVKDIGDDIKDDAEDLGDDIRDGAEDVKDNADDMMEKTNPDYNGAAGPAADKDIK